MTGVPSCQGRDQGDMAAGCFAVAKRQDHRFGPGKQRPGEMDEALGYDAECVGVQAALEGRIDDEFIDAPEATGQCLAATPGRQPSDAARPGQDPVPSAS